MNLSMIYGHVAMDMDTHASSDQIYMHLQTNRFLVDLLAADMSRPLPITAGYADVDHISFFLTCFRQLNKA